MIPLRDARMQLEDNLGMKRGLLAVAWAVCLLLGCGDGSSATTHSGHPCQAANFKVSELRGVGLGTTYDRLTLRSTASAPCVLGQAVRAQVIDPRGNAVLASKPNAVGPRLITVAPGEAAQVLIGWGNWCRESRGPFHARLLLPAHGGSLLTGRYGPASCTGPASTPSTVAIADFRRATK